jgi:hypothetical protein
MEIEIQIRKRSVNLPFKGPDKCDLTYHAPIADTYHPISRLFSSRLLYLFRPNTKAACSKVTFSLLSTYGTVYCIQYMFGSRVWTRLIPNSRNNRSILTIKTLHLIVSSLASSNTVPSGFLMDAIAMRMRIPVTLPSSDES